MRRLPCWTVAAVAREAAASTPIARATDPRRLCVGLDGTAIWVAPGIIVRLVFALVPSAPRQPPQSSARRSSHRVRDAAEAPCRHTRPPSPQLTDNGVYGPMAVYFGNELSRVRPSGMSGARSSAGPSPPRAPT